MSVPRRLAAGAPLRCQDLYELEIYACRDHDPDRQCVHEDERCSCVERAFPGQWRRDEFEACCYPEELRGRGFAVRLCCTCRDNLHHLSDEQLLAEVEQALIEAGLLRAAA